MEERPTIYKDAQIIRTTAPFVHVLIESFAGTVEIGQSESVTVPRVPGGRGVQ